MAIQQPSTDRPCDQTDPPPKDDELPLSSNTAPKTKTSSVTPNNEAFVKFWKGATTVNSRSQEQIQKEPKSSPIILKNNVTGIPNKDAATSVTLTQSDFVIAVNLDPKSMWQYIQDLEARNSFLQQQLESFHNNILSSAQVALSEMLTAIGRTVSNTSGTFDGVGKDLNAITTTNRAVRTRPAVMRSYGGASNTSEKGNGQEGSMEISLSNDSRKLPQLQKSTTVKPSWVHAEVFQPKPNVDSPRPKTSVSDQGSSTINTQEVSSPPPKLQSLGEWGGVKSLTKLHPPASKPPPSGEESESKSHSKAELATLPEASFRIFFQPEEKLIPESYNVQPSDNSYRSVSNPKFVYDESDGHVWQPAQIVEELAPEKVFKTEAATLPAVPLANLFQPKVTQSKEDVMQPKEKQQTEEPQLCEPSEDLQLKVIRKIVLSGFDQITDSTQINVLLSRLITQFKGVCPEALTMGKCRRKGCNLIVPCPCYNRNIAGKECHKTCKDAQVRYTCEIQAEGKHCRKEKAVTKGGGPNKHKDLAHEGSCTADE